MEHDIQKKNKQSRNEWQIKKWVAKK